VDGGRVRPPIDELYRIYRTTSRRLGYRSFSEVRGPDVVELKRALHRLGFYKKDLEDGIPEPPELDLDRSRMREDPEGFQKAIEGFRETMRAYSGAWEIYDAETMDAVDAFRKQQGLDHLGNPRGLVDDRLVEALRRAAQQPAPAPAASDLPYEIRELAPGRLVATGDLLDALPYGGHGYPKEWIAALDELETLGFDRVVPGHGPVQEGAGQLRLVRELFSQIVHLAETAVRSGEGLEAARDRAMETAALRSLRERLAGEDTRANRAFDGFVPPTFERAYLEASGTLPD